MQEEKDIELSWDALGRMKAQAETCRNPLPRNVLEPFGKPVP